MKKNILETTKVLVILAIAIFSIGIASAWTAPNLAPTEDNVAAPINVSDSTQDKLGILNVRGFSNLGTAWFSTSSRAGWPLPNTKLTLAVNGTVGAKEYCDDNEVNCFTAPQVNNIVNNNTGFPAPDYDSGWLQIGLGAGRWITHNLGTMETMVYLEYSSDLGNPPLRPGQSGYGLFTWNQVTSYGMEWSNKELNRIYVTNSNEGAKRFRVQIWKIN